MKEVYSDHCCIFVVILNIVAVGIRITEQYVTRIRNPEDLLCPYVLNHIFLIT